MREKKGNKKWWWSAPRLAGGVSILHSLPFSISLSFLLSSFFSFSQQREETPLEQKVRRFEFEKEKEKQERRNELHQVQQAKKNSKKEER